MSLLHIRCIDHGWLIAQGFLLSKSAHLSTFTMGSISGNLLKIIARSPISPSYHDALIQKLTYVVEFVSATTRLICSSHGNNGLKLGSSLSRAKPQGKKLQAATRQKEGECHLLPSNLRIRTVQYLSICRHLSLETSNCLAAQANLISISSSCHLKKRSAAGRAAYLWTVSTSMSKLRSCLFFITRTKYYSRSKLQGNRTLSFIPMAPIARRVEGILSAYPPLHNTVRRNLPLYLPSFIRLAGRFSRWLARPSKAAVPCQGSPRGKLSFPSGLSTNEALRDFAARPRLLDGTGLEGTAQMSWTTQRAAVVHSQFKYSVAVLGSSVSVIWICIQGC